MKTFKHLLLFLALGLTLNLSAQTCDDLFAGPDPACTDIGEFTVTVPLPDYPGCTLTATYETKICQGVFNNRFLSATINDGCQDFIVDLLTLFFGGDEVRLEFFLQGVIKDILTGISDSQFDIFIASGQGSLVDCNTGISQFATNWYDGACISTCISQGPKGQFVITPVNCGRVCCVKSYEYCYNSKSGETEVTITNNGSEVQPGSCFFSDLPTCPEGALFQSPCFINCETE